MTGGGNCPPQLSPLNFFSAYRKILFQIYNIWADSPPISGKFGGKIEILYTHIWSIGNLQLSVGKLQLLVPPPALVNKLIN